MRDTLTSLNEKTTQPYQTCIKLGEAKKQLLSMRLIRTYSPIGPRSHASKDASVTVAHPLGDGPQPPLLPLLSPAASVMMSSLPPLAVYRIISTDVVEW